MEITSATQLHVKVFEQRLIKDGGKLIIKLRDEYVLGKNSHIETLVQMHFGMKYCIALK